MPDAIRPSAADLARRAARMTISRAVHAAAVPARALARAGRGDADPRWAGVSWIWQPGWGRHRHDRLYRTANPYGIATSPYEQDKYDRVLDALSGRRYGRVLEVGCGEGDLSARLTALTGDLLGVDISAAATARAAARVPSAAFETRMLPSGMPDGPFDLIVCTDVLYYWEDSTLRRGLDRLVERLAPGGTLVAYHYRGDFGQANTADRVHDLIAGLAGRGLGVRAERLAGIGPGGAGARFDVVSVPAPAVPAQRAAEPARDGVPAR